MVASQPAAATGPAERPLDHPPPRMHGEALLAGRCAHNRHRDRRGRANALACIGLVGKGLREKGPGTARGAQESNPAMAVMQAGGRDGGEEHASVCIGHDMALAANHTASRVEAALACDAYPARARRLRVEHGSCGACFTSSPFTVGHGERVREALEGPGPG